MGRMEDGTAKCAGSLLLEIGRFFAVMYNCILLKFVYNAVEIRWDDLTVQSMEKRGWRKKL